MTALFFRHGREFTGTAQANAKGRPVTHIQDACGRCGGMGRAEQWRHTGWTCYQCGGSGKGSMRVVPLYSAEQIAKLDATQAKKGARKEAAQQAKEEAIRVEAAARWDTFETKHRDLLAWLENLPLSDEMGSAADFLTDMLRKGRRFASWTDTQVEALRKFKAAREAAEAKRAGSDWVGEVGKRMDVAVTVERVFTFQRPRFGAGWQEETVYIATLRDHAGNAIVSKSASFSPKVGDQMEIRATVKAHDTYRDERQTTVSRVAVKAKRDGMEAGPADIVAVSGAAAAASCSC